VRASPRLSSARERVSENYWPEKLVHDTPSSRCDPRRDVVDYARATAWVEVVGVPERQPSPFGAVPEHGAVPRLLASVGAGCR
jgi:hypothetical protein